jgi:hypothetical protein
VKIILLILSFQVIWNNSHKQKSNIKDMEQECFIHIETTFSNILQDQVREEEWQGRKEQEDK